MSEHPTPPSTDRSALIVEDDYVVALLLEEMLYELGYSDIRHVDNVDAALVSIARTAPDVAVLDANLKGVFSSPVAQDLRQRGVPFVVGTGFERAQLPDDLRNGVHLRKPYTVPLLARAIEDASRA